MKNLKTVAIVLIIVYILIQYVSSASYYKHVFSDDLIGNYSAITNLLMVFIRGLLNIMVIVLGILALSSADANGRDRAYSIFRYVYVVAYLINFPVSLYYMIGSAKYLFAVPSSTLIIIGQHLISITFIVLLLIAKPEKRVLGVNLQNYDMVSFTTTGHRFVHYLLDSLFLTPIFLSAAGLLYVTARMMAYRDPNPLLIMFLVFLIFFLYYFLSEAIFGQTFGKMITRSCVATVGVEYTNGRIFLRTICRLIPFDRISFLFGANWHDRVSATAVVYVDSWESAFEEQPNSEPA